MISRFTSITVLPCMPTNNNSPKTRFTQYESNKLFPTGVACLKYDECSKYDPFNLEAYHIPCHSDNLRCLLFYVLATSKVISGQPQQSQKYKLLAWCVSMLKTCKYCTIPQEMIDNGMCRYTNAIPMQVTVQCSALLNNKWP